MRVLGVGIATLDVVNSVYSYPQENAEVRAVSQRLCRGGNATNTLVVLSQQGNLCSWAGVLPRDRDAELVISDLDRFGVQHGLCTRPQQGKLPTSYVCLNQANGSRTIVHYRDMPEYEFTAFDSIDLGMFDWVHFEGRAVAELEPMLRKVASQSGLRCSLEVEKPRPGIESLIPLADLALLSREYVRGMGFDTATEYLRQQQGECYVAWGEAGAWALDCNSQLHHSPAYPPLQLRDTLGAGDVFNAGVIHARAQQSTVAGALTFACRLAGYKCGIDGFAGVAL